MDRFCLPHQNLGNLKTCPFHILFSVGNSTSQYPNILSFSLTSSVISTISITFNLYDDGYFPYFRLWMKRVTNGELEPDPLVFILHVSWWSRCWAFPLFLLVTCISTKHIFLKKPPIIRENDYHRSRTRNCHQKDLRRYVYGMDGLPKKYKKFKFLAISSPRLIIVTSTRFHSMFWK